MIFPAEKRALIKFLDQHGAALGLPGWAVEIIRQLVAEHDELERKSDELIEKLVQVANRFHSQAALCARGLECPNWHLNPDGERACELINQEPQEPFENTMECWM